MSGGTDSSVAALLLQDAGYEVTGITFRFYEKENDTGKRKRKLFVHLDLVTPDDFIFIAHRIAAKFIIRFISSGSCHGTVQIQLLALEAAAVEQTIEIQLRSLGDSLLLAYRILFRNMHARTVV